MACKYKHRSTAVFEEILFNRHHHIARLAWLIQKYIFLVKQQSGPTTNLVEVTGLFVTSLI